MNGTEITGKLIMMRFRLPVISVACIYAINAIKNNSMLK